jgi:hypothetical protein
MIPLNYDINVIGVDKIKSALRSVEQGVRAHNARVKNDVDRAAAVRSRSASAEARSASTTKRDLAAAAMAAQKRAVTEERLADRAEQSRRRAERLAEGAERRRQRASEALEASRNKALLRSRKDALRDDADKARREKQIAEAEDKAKSRVIEKQRRAQAESDRYSQRLLGRADAYTQTTRRMAGIAMGTLAVTGGALLASGVATELDERAQASKLANQAGAPERKAEILAKVRSKDLVGTSGAEAMAGLGSWMDLTGDLDTGLGILKELNDVALSTNVSLQDLGSAAGNAFIPLKDSIDDPKKRLEALKQTIRGMAGMGTVGAVEIKDLASEMAGLAAQATKFQGGPEEVMRTSVAMAQAARQRGGATSAAEAVTSVARFGSDVLTKQADLRQIGVEVFTDTSRTQMRAQKDIMADVLVKSGGDLGKLNAIFGERSIRAIQGFSPLYTAAEQKSAALRKSGDKTAPAKGAAGRAAVMAEFGRLESSTLSDERIRAAKASRMQDADVQFKEVMKELKYTVGAELLPVLTQLIPELAKLGPIAKDAAVGLGHIITWFSQNPRLGIGAVVGAAIVKDVAAAELGKAVSSAIAQNNKLSIGGVTAITGSFVVGAAVGVAIADAIFDALTGKADAEQSKGVQDVVKAQQKTTSSAEVEKMISAKEADLERIQQGPSGLSWESAGEVYGNLYEYGTGVLSGDFSGEGRNNRPQESPVRKSEHRAPGRIRRW